MHAQFPQILHFFQALKIGVPSILSRETSIFEIMIDDVKAQIYMVSLLDFILLVCVSFTIIGQPRNSVLIRRV